MTRPGKLAMLLISCFMVTAWAVPTRGQVATDGKLLRWNMKAGQAFDVVVVQDMKQKQTIGGQEMESSTAMRIEMTWEVTEVDEDGVMSVSQSLDRVSMQAQTPMGEIAFDTASDEEPQGMAAMVASTMQPMIGAKFVQKMNPRGEALAPEVPEGAENGAPGAPSPEMLKQMLSNATLPMPEQAVEDGTTWTDETSTEVPQLGQVTINRTFTYRGEEEQDSRTVAKIDMEMDTTFGEGGANAMGMKMKVKSQNTEGTLYFDTDAGYLTGSQVNQKMDMTIEAMGQTVDQVQDSTTTTTVTPKQNG